MASKVGVFAVTVDKNERYILQKKKREDLLKILNCRPDGKPGMKRIAERKNGLKEREKNERKKKKKKKEERGKERRI